MASIKVSDLQATTSTAAESFLYVADTTNGGVEFDSKKITVANFLNAYATEAFVSTQISDLINGAPEALNTLKEISDVIGDSNDVVGNLISMINANETHVDNVATLTGVAKDSADMGSFSGSTIADSSTIKSALQALETSLETKGAATDLSGVISNTGDLVTLSGVAAGSVNLGVFDGNTLSDDATLKVVLQDAEDAIEANASAISSEASTRAAAITALTDGAVASNTAAINQEISDRAAAITALTNGAVADNAAGIVTNAAAITSLTNGAVATNAAAIAQEVTDREAAVSAEATARSAADALLMPKAGGTFTGAISGPAPTADLHLATKKYADDLVANVDLSQVETNRVDIAAETAARTSADTALSGRLDTLEADPTTQTLLTAETTARTSADTALSGRLDTLEADPTTQSLLTAETTARTAADTALSNRLDTLEADPTTQTLLDAETAARIAGDALKLDLAGGTMTGAINLGAASGPVTTTLYTNNDPTVDAGLSVPAVGWTAYVASDPIPDGKSYVEITLGNYIARIIAGVTDGTDVRFHYVTSNPGLTVFDVYTWHRAYEGNTKVYEDSSPTAPAEGDVLGFLMDKDNNTISYFYNGVLVHTSTVDMTGADYRWGFSVVNTTATVNFGGSAFDNQPAGSQAYGGGASAGASIINVDGTATFGGNVTASAVPSDDAHLVNKLYADNLVAGVDLSGIATNAAAIEALTNGAPDLLNTLNEIANAIGDDENFATTITNQISAESTTRASADTALSGRLDVLEADPTTATALASEASTRATADTALSNRLDTLEADPTTATAVTNAIAAETAARQAADALHLPLAGGTMTGDINLGASATIYTLTNTYGVRQVDYNQPEPVSQVVVSSQNPGSDTPRVSQIYNGAPNFDTITDSTGWQVISSTGAFAAGSGPENLFDGNQNSFVIPSENGATLTIIPPSPITERIFFKGEGNESYAFHQGGGSGASVLGVDGTATFGGNITASAVPTANDHLVNKLYADSLVAGVDLSGIATNTAAISAEATTRAAADTALSGRLDTLEADPTTQTLLDAETAARQALEALVLPLAGGTMTGDLTISGGSDISSDGGASFDGNVNAGSATIDGNVTAGTAPSSNDHLVNKAYVDTLVANIDLSQVETNRLDIIQEIADRTAAITALTNGQVATNTSGIATNATAITNLTNGAVADNAAAITALTNGAVASNTAAINQEVTDRQAAVAALTNGAVADNAAAITALTNGAVADNAAAVTQEAADRAAADALKVDKQSLVNEHLLGQTSAQSAPVDAQGNSNYLFLVVDKATGALKSIDKTFLEAE